MHVNAALNFEVPVARFAALVVNVLPPTLL
jgi:hypothetical protein